MQKKRKLKWCNKHVYANHLMFKSRECCRKWQSRLSAIYVVTMNLTVVVNNKDISIIIMEETLTQACTENSKKSYWGLASNDCAGFFNVNLFIILHSIYLFTLFWLRECEVRCKHVSLFRKAEKALSRCLALKKNQSRIKRHPATSVNMMI